MVDADREFRHQLHKVYGWYTLGVLVFIAFVAWLESRGLRREWIGGGFLLATIAVYATVGVICRTTDTHEYSASTYFISSGAGRYVLSPVVL